MNLHEELERRRAVIVAQQLNAGAWLVIALTVYVVLAAYLVDTPSYTVNYWTRPGSVVVAFGILWALRLPDGRVDPRLLALASCTLICLAPALAGAFGGEFEGNAALILLIGLAAGALFPWGMATQALLAVLLFAMLSAARATHEYLAAAPPEIGIMNAVVGGLAVSVLIAIRTQRTFETAVTENLALAEARDEIRKLNAGLESTVRERTEELEVALTDQRSFTYALSHDIRQPLRHIDGYLHMYEERATARLDGADRDLFARAYDSLLRAGRMIDSLLHLTRLGTGPVHRASIDVSALAGEIVHNLGVAEEERDVAIDIEAGMTAEGDPHLVYLLLRNLLDNAWKFTRSAEDATITVTTEPGGIYVVRDNGVGFDMEFADKLFGTFQRLVATDEFSGEGVGLAAAQRIVRHHGGRIWGESVPGDGSTFRFTLQREAADLGASQNVLSP